MRAERGDILTPTISKEFREVLTAERDADTWAAIVDENPGEFPIHV